MAASVNPLQPLQAVFAVAVQCIEDNGIRFARGAYLIHLDGLAFEQLVVLEKPSQHNQAVRRHFRGLVVGVELGILGGDGISTAQSNSCGSLSPGVTSCQG